MECLKLHPNVYKGRVIEMSIFKSDRDKDIEKGDLKDIIKNLESKMDKLDKKVEECTKGKMNGRMRFGIEIVTFILSMFAAFGTAFKYFEGKFTDINTQLDTCLTEEDIESLKLSVEEIETWVKGDINDATKPGANSRINEIENLLNISPINVNKSIAMNNLIYTASMENAHSTIDISLTSETYLGEDSNGNKYNLGDVVGKKVLLTYNEDDKEVFFWGQLNDKLHWDGYCVTNAYNSDGTLYGICESNFDDGNRLNYESFYLSSTENEWIYTNRICEKEGNLGISEKISFEYNKEKNFTNTNARIYDFLYVKDFAGLENKTMLSYYYGYTTNGKYNDQSNDEQHTSYEIIFNPDGTVKTLYIGQFAHGYFHDQTGNAKEIVFDSFNNINKYFYYKGTFTNGNRDGDVSSANYVTQTQIDEIIADETFGVELNWYKTNNDL